MSFASRITRGALDNTGTEVVVASGNDVEVFGFLVSNISAGANRRCLIKDSDDTTFMNVELDQGSTFIMSTPFIAHNGIKFVNGTGAVTGWSVTCWHSSAGAVKRPFTAPKYSYQAMSSAFTVESGGPIKVYGISLINGGTSNNVVITLTDNDGNVIHKYELDASSSISGCPLPFMADNGLKITSSAADAEISATVFHSNPGV